MPPDAQVADSSTARETPPDLSTLSGPEYAKWRETGEIAEPKPAESAPASAAPDKGETAPAPEPEPKTEQREPEKVKGADARKAQLAAEIQDLLRQRRELRQTVEREKGDQDAPAAPAAPAADGEPVFTDFLGKAETYEAAVQEFQRAHSRWSFEQFQAEQRRAEQERTISEQRMAFAARVEKDSLAFDDFDAITSAAVDLRPTPAMLGAIHESEIPGKLLYHLAKNPTEFHRIAALTPAKAIRELGKIEDSLLATASPPSSLPAPKKHSTAPPPPTELAARNTAPEDEAMAALEDGQHGRYIEIMNARELEQIRRRA